ncbi:hypothetical protein K2X33_15035 [bacterium]|nr:hypothetical protein [bacterium]
MRTLLALCLLGTAAHAEIKTLVDETFTASLTGSTKEILRCTPGTNGGYALADILHLKAVAVHTGYYTQHSEFTARTKVSTADLNAPQAPRPYDKGCQPAVDAVSQAIDGKDSVEVKVQRKVVSIPDVKQRTTYKGGEPVHTDYIRSENWLETIEFELGGLEFKISQMINGK